MHYVQIILIGIFAGSVYAIGGTGIVLTYKATGVFNLAHFTIGLFSAYLLWQMNGVWKIPLWISAPAVLLVVGPGIGVLLERVVFRSLQRRRASTSEKLVANLGVENVGIDDAGNPVAEPVTVRLTFFDPATGEQDGDPVQFTLAPGVVRQINDVVRSTRIVFVDQIAGTAQIRGYVVMKDAATNDGSLVFMQESPAQTF